VNLEGGGEKEESPAPFIKSLLAVWCKQQL